MTLALSLPERGSPADELLEPSPGLLQQIVREYESELGAGRPELIDCLFLFVPSQLLRRCLLTDLRNLPTDAYLWLMDSCSYHRGAWLRQQLRRTQLETMSTLPGAPLPVETFARTVETARQGCRASEGSGREALDYLEQTIHELVAAFAYVRGSVLYGLTLPAPDSTLHRDLIVAGGLLWCGYRDPRLEVISHLHDVSVRLERGSEPRWRELASWISPLQRDEAERARNVWRAQAGLSRIPDFVPLLESTAAFLECVQAAVLMSVRSLAESDGVSARRAALVSAIVQLGMDSYSLGLMDSTHDGDPDRGRPLLRT